MIIDCEANYRLKQNTRPAVGVSSDRMAEAELKIVMIDTDDMTALVRPAKQPASTDRHAWFYIDDLIKVEED